MLAMDEYGKIYEEANEIEVYRQVLRRWKPEDQAVVWLEELAELQKEICKLLRFGVLGKPAAMFNLAAVVEEIADVEIILGEMKLALDIFSAVQNEKQRKLKRLQERLKE